MYRSALRHLVLPLSLFMVSISPIQANLLLNGGFEAGSPFVSGNSWSVSFSNPNASCGFIWSDSVPTLADNCEAGKNFTPGTVPEGTHYIALSAHETPPLDPIATYLSQNFPTTVGTIYNISFSVKIDAAPTFGYVYNELKLHVDAMDRPLYSFTDKLFDWKTVWVLFRANGTSTTLTFRVLNDPVYTYLDAISVEAAIIQAFLSPPPPPPPFHALATSCDARSVCGRKRSGCKVFKCKPNALCVHASKSMRRKMKPQCKGFTCQCRQGYKMCKVDGTDQCLGARLCYLKATECPPFSQLNFS